MALVTNRKLIMNKKRSTFKKISRCAEFITLFIFIFSIFSTHTKALSTEQKKLYNQNILYYDLETASCISDSGTDVALTGLDNAQKIWNYLIAKGLTEIQTAGIMGNLSVETAGTFSPTTQEGGKSPPFGGYGIAQWTGTGHPGDRAGARRLNLIKFIQKAGLSVDLNTEVALPPFDNDKLLTAELDYMWEEGASAIAQIRKETTIAGAVQSWMDNFERAQVRVQPARVARAQAIKTKFGGTATTITSTTTTTGSISCNSVSTSSTGDLASMVLKYAWPDYHPAPYLTAKQEYKDAITKAIADKQYVGGLGNPGIDCGGFVTRLMIDSGFEPNYNYGGSLAAGAGTTIAQEAWLKSNWTKINPATSKDLQQGDVAINADHTFVYVGDIPGFNSKVASASVSFTGASWRAPMAGHETPADPSFNWYRKK